MDETKTVDRVGGYRVVRRLATGGTSDVLLAKAEGPHGFERTVVLKLLLSQYRNDEEFAKMFAREAAAYARLSNPAIVQLYDFFQLDGQLVMVLEYVDGAPLSRLRGMLKAVGQNLDDRASLFIAQRIFSALAAAHESTGDQGRATPVIHRDVNPSNVLITWDGGVKLADFGIARVTGVTQESAAGLIKGTYGYMAPEQVEGGTITPRVDVYAAGIILWELLTRRRAFQRGALPELEVLRAMAEPRITSIDILRPDVDRTLREAISRCLAPKVDKRKITAEEMVEILKGIVPNDEGQERLASLLAAVRHEPKPQSTSMPPPMTDPMPQAPARPAPRQPPRPASVRRMGAVAGPNRTASGPLPTVTAPKPHSAKLPTGTAVGIGSPPNLAQTMRESEKMHVATPLEISPSVALKQAIDEILTNVPSSIPPSVLMPMKAAYPDSSERPPPGPETPRTIAMPGPFPALNVTMPLGQSFNPPGVTQPAPPLSAEPPPAPPLVSIEPSQGFDQTMREIERAEQPTVMPKSLDATLAIEDPDAKVATSKVPAYQLPPQAPPQVAAPPVPDSFPPLAPAMMMQPHVPPPAASSPPNVTGSHAALLPQPKASSVGVLAFMLVIIIAAGVAGTVVYVRHERAKRIRTKTVATTPPPPATSIAQPFVPPPPPSETAAPEESASASASASAAPTVVPSASAAPVTTASAAPGEVPAGMGVVHTTGAAPNRRIFVDEKTVGQTPESVTVKCGTHAVKLGSAGKTQTIEIPCGGEITVSDR